MQLPLGEKWESEKENREDFHLAIPYDFGRKFNSQAIGFISFTFTLSLNPIKHTYMRFEVS